MKQNLLTIALSTGLGVAALMPPMAHASTVPWVYAYAYANGPLLQGAEAGYNIPAGGCDITTNAACSSTNLNGQAPPASVTAYANGDAAGLSTQTSVGAETLGFPYREPLPPATVSSAYAAANLADGSLHVIASNNATGLAGPNMAWLDGASSHAYAGLHDVIHFTSTGATQVAFTFSVDGSMGHGALPSYSLPQGGMETYVAFGGYQARYLVQYDVNDPARPLVASNTSPLEPSGNWVIDISNPSALALTFFGLLDITTQKDWTMNAFMDVNCSSGVQCDFGNTAKLSFNLPSGVQFTSDSGALLTAVPVPAAIWLFGSALVGLIGMGRRKRF